jgi:hypothetical protein
MPAQSQLRYLRRIHRQERLVPAIILQYDPTSRDLHPWFWYVHDWSSQLQNDAEELNYLNQRPVSRTGARVTPTDLVEHRRAHDFKAPCCLCACSSIVYTESAIYIAVKGQYSGEYVAGCASDSCGYLSESAFFFDPMSDYLCCTISQSGPHVYEERPTDKEVP